MSQSGNLETVQSLYQAFGARDGERLLAILHPQVEWIQNEGFPGGGHHVGATTVLEEVFARFRAEWESWGADVERWLDAGDAIVALGTYRGTHKATGKSTRAAFAHIYWLRDGQIVRMEQYTDTLKVAEATWPDAGHST